jgi:hypothetical protein
MRLWELFEDLSSAEIKAVQNVLNKQIYMPEPAVKAGGDVIKLVLPPGQHFGDRALSDRGIDQNYTAKELASLLMRARTDPSLGYAHIISAGAAWNGPGDYDPNGAGIKIKDPQTGLLVPFVVKPNPAAQRPITPTTVMTANGLEPKNIFKAKSIMRKAPGVDDPLRARRPPEPANTNSRYAGRRIDPTIGRFASNRRAKPDMSNYDDGSTD